MTSPDEPLPSRMRSYRVEAELRETPDLHQLAQLFIGMALARTELDLANRHAPESGQRRSGAVESDTKEASG